MEQILDEVAYLEQTVLEHKISLRGVDSLQLLGQGDRHLHEIAKEFSALIVARGQEITLRGSESEIKTLERIFTELILMLNRNGELREADVETVVAVAKRGEMQAPAGGNHANERPVIVYTKHAAVKPKSAGQLEFLQATQKNDIVFAIGPAGTGKTYLAVAIAEAHLRDLQMDRIVLTRPAVYAV